MALSKIKIGSLIELYKSRCDIPNLLPENVSGVNKEKEFFEPSKQVANDTSNYKVVPPLFFACNLMHIGRDVVLPIAINRTKQNKYVSPAYTVFKLKNQNTILNEYLFILLNSAEKDRYFWFHCDSSVRDGMDWNSFCEMELEIPSIQIQRKYVAIYDGLLANLHSYEKGLDDLKLVCDGYIEELRRKGKTSLLGKLQESNEKNVDKIATSEKGVSIQKKLIPTKANSSDVTKQKLVRTGYFAFNSNTSRNSDMLSIALNLEEPCAVSNTYIVFKATQDIFPEYLYLWFTRKEFDRFARYNSWGSARETIDLKAIENYQIALPDLKIQKSIVLVLKIYETRLGYINELKMIINKICPMLIRGSIEESVRGSL